MRGWQHYFYAAFGVMLLGATLSVTGAGTALAQGGRQAFETLIINDSSSPVPVAVPNPVVVTSSPWQGTPFLDSRVLINSDATGFEQCGSVFTAAPGTAVLLKTISASFNVPPGGSGGLRVILTAPGGAQDVVGIPTHRTAGAQRVNEVFDQFSGSLVLDGFPVTEATGCLSGSESAGSLAFVGFTVASPQ